VRLKQGLVKKTLLRTAPGVFEERHATWLELFYDLAFVAVISQISHNLAEDFTFVGVLKACAFYVPVWWAWVGQAFYLSRFDSDDIIHRLLALAQILIAAFMAVSISPAFDGNADYFAMCYAAIRGILVVQYFVAGSQLPKAKRLTKRYCFGFGLAAVLWVASMFVEPAVQFVLWGLAFAIDFITPLTAVQASIDLPPNYSHIPERFGLFTIIVLGEAILAAVSGMQMEKSGSISLLIGPLGLVLAFSIWWMYFDGVRGNQVQIPKLRKDARRLLTWMYSHLVLSLGIVVTSVGIKKGMLAQGLAQMKPVEATIFTLGVSAVMIALHVIQVTGLNRKLFKIVFKLSLPHWLTSIALVSTLAFCSRIPAIGLISWLCVLCVLQVLWTLREMPEMDELLRKIESAKRQTASQV